MRGSCIAPSLCLLLCLSVFLYYCQTLSVTLALCIRPHFTLLALCWLLSPGFPTILHEFVYFLLCSSRRVPVVLFLSVALLFCKTLTLLSACFSFVSVSSCIPLSVSPSPAPSASPDIHGEIFSHVGYRFMTPARSPWPLNLIPSTKPHCFFVCVRACLLCAIVRKYVCACLGECVHALQGGGG